MMRFLSIKLVSITLIVLSFAVVSSADPFFDDLAAAAIERTRFEVTYDGSYFRIDYPNGDVPADKGVCTDVVIRAYRKVGVDLQAEVHRDMKAHFDKYPGKWGLTRPDPNIDHRRVPNLQVFFTRKGRALTPSRRPEDYRPGDLVTWMLPGNLSHIGMVVGTKSRDGRRHLIVHNIGRGPRMEDVLFDFPITGHYRYRGRPAREVQRAGQPLQR